MTKPITKFDDVVEIYFESGSAQIRFKDGMSLESLLDEQINQTKMLNLACTSDLKQPKTVPCEGGDFEPK